MTNQTPSSAARTVSEEVGVAATTIPAMRLTTPKAIHQPLPSPSAACDSSDKRGHALHDPADAHEQADERNGQMQMADQDDADDDKQQAGYAQPYPVRFVAVEYADQVEDPREDHQDADQDRDEVQRPVRVKAHDDPEDQCQHAENQRRLP